MGFGLSTTRLRDEVVHGFARLLCLLAFCAVPSVGLAQPASGCDKPVYLTLDTGHMGVAPYMANVLKRHGVRVTFFAANERTQTGGTSLGDDWGAWWRERAAEGHDFASHTYDHVYWRADVDGPLKQFKVRPSAGPNEGREMVWSAADYCAEIKRSADRLAAVTGKRALPLFRAPGGKTSSRLLAVSAACGYAHVGWSPAGFLGDELPSEHISNDKLLKKALRDVKAGDILMAHLGIWSRKDPWATSVLEPLITGLQAKGLCFRTLRDHPRYREWIQRFEQ